MASKTAEQAVRTYLSAVQDASSLLDEAHIRQLEADLAGADDALQRIVLRQRLMEARKPSLEKVEEGFVTHAKAWADDNDVTVAAFAEENVKPEVLRKAGFPVPGTRGRGRAKATSTGPRRGRVTVEQIRGAIPKGTFTVKRLEEASGASTASVRKVISEQLSAGDIVAEGTDPDHKGPGRAPLLYRRKK